MCGDTGLPRWYVKIGNEARIEGGPVALEAALRRATANATHDVPLRPNRVHPLWRTDHNNNCRHRRAGDRIRLPSRRRLDRPHHRAQGRPVRHRLPHAVPRRRHRRHQALLSRHADRVRQARARLPAGHRRRRPRRLQGHLRWCSASRPPACASSARAIPIPKIAALEDELKELGNSIGMGAMGFMGSSMVVDCHIEVGYCHTGGMPMSVHMFCLSSRRATRAHPSRRPRRVPHRSGVVHRLHAAARRWNGSGRWSRRRSERDGRCGLKTVHLDLPARTDDLRELEIGTVVYLTGRVFTRARASTSARSRTAPACRRRATRSASPTSTARRRPRVNRRRQLHRRRRHRDRVVPLRQVARRLVQALRLQHHHRQGRHDVGGLSQVVRAATTRSISPPSATAPARCSAAASSGSRASTGSRSWARAGDLGARGGEVRAVPGRERPRRQQSLFERENAKIAPGLEQLYEGTRPATLRRYGETDDKTDEVI